MDNSPEDSKALLNAGVVEVEGDHSFKKALVPSASPLKDLEMGNAANPLSDAINSIKDENSDSLMFPIPKYFNKALAQKLLHKKGVEDEKSLRSEPGDIDSEVLQTGGAAEKGTVSVTLKQSEAFELSEEDSLDAVKRQELLSQKAIVPETATNLKAVADKTTTPIVINNPKIIFTDGIIPPQANADDLLLSRDQEENEKKTSSPQFDFDALEKFLNNRKPLIYPRTLDEEEKKLQRSKGFLSSDIPTGSPLPQPSPLKNSLQVPLVAAAATSAALKQNSEEKDLERSLEIQTESFGKWNINGLDASKRFTNLKESHIGEGDIPEDIEIHSKTNLQKYLNDQISNPFGTSNLLKDTVSHTASMATVFSKESFQQSRQAQRQKVNDERVILPAAATVVQTIQQQQQTLTIQEDMFRKIVQEEFRNLIAAGGLAKSPNLVSAPTEQFSQTSLLISPRTVAGVEKRTGLAANNSIVDQLVGSNRVINLASNRPIGSLRNIENPGGSNSNIGSTRLIEDKQQEDKRSLGHRGKIALRTAFKLTGGRLNKPTIQSSFSANAATAAQRDSQEQQQQPMIPSIGSSIKGDSALHIQSQDTIETSMQMHQAQRDSSRHIHSNSGVANLGEISFNLNKQSQNRLVNNNNRKEEAFGSMRSITSPQSDFLLKDKSTQWLEKMTQSRDVKTYTNSLAAFDSLDSVPQSEFLPQEHNQYQQVFSQQQWNQTAEGFQSLIHHPPMRVRGLSSHDGKDQVIEGDEGVLEFIQQQQQQMQQQDNKNSDQESESVTQIWEKALEFYERGLLNRAYQTILDLEDDVYLLRLMSISRPCFKKLNSNVGKRLIRRINKIMQSSFMDTLALQLFSSAQQLDLFEHTTLGDTENVKNVLYDLSASPDIGEQAATLYNSIDAVDRS